MGIDGLGSTQRYRNIHSRLYESKRNEARMLTTMMRSLVSLVLLLTIILQGNQVLGSEGDGVCDHLDRQWGKIMLDGETAIQIDDEPLITGSTPYQTYKGEVDQVWISDRGIRLEDLRGTSLGGLLSKGGMRLQGGLLYAVNYKNGGAIELYGKSRWKVQPSLFHFGKSPPRSAEHSYDFFLLYRPVEGHAAQELKRWTVPAERVPYDYYLRGQLTYDPAADVATVTVDGVNDAKVFISENVRLGEVISRK